MAHSCAGSRASEFARRSLASSARCGRSRPQPSPRAAAGPRPPARRCNARRRARRRAACRRDVRSNVSPATRDFRKLEFSLWAGRPTAGRQDASAGSQHSRTGKLEPLTNRVRAGTAARACTQHDRKRILPTAVWTKTGFRTPDAGCETSDPDARRHAARTTTHSQLSAFDGLLGGPDR